MKLETKSCNGPRLIQTATIACGINCVHCIDTDRAIKAHMRMGLQADFQFLIHLPAQGYMAILSPARPRCKRRFVS